MSSAGGRSPRAATAPRRCPVSNGWIRSGSAFGVTFWPMPPFGFAPGAPPRRRRRSRRAAAAGVQHRRLVEVDRQIGAVVAVDDRALHVGDLRAQDRAAHEQLRRLLDGDAGGDAVLREDRRRRSFGDQRAALLHELHRAPSSPSMPMPPRMSSLESTNAEVRELRRLLVRQRRAAGLRHAVDLRHRAAADVREDDHVVLRAQVALAQLLIGEVGVRHAVGVERRAHPAFVLRARPAVDVADARDVEVVRLHRRRRRHRPRRQAELLQHRLELRAIGVRR